MMKTITIDPVTRLEGHGKISIFLDEKGDVANAYLQIPSFVVSNDFVKVAELKICLRSLVVYVAYVLLLIISRRQKHWMLRLMLILLLRQKN